MGITGAMKIAHFARRSGSTSSITPAVRALAVMAATPNTRFYEMALLGPDMPNSHAGLHARTSTSQMRVESMAASQFRGPGLVAVRLGLHRAGATSACPRVTSPCISAGILRSREAVDGRTTVAGPNARRQGPELE